MNDAAKKGLNLNLYQKGHILLAAIRVLEFQNEYPPSVDDLAGFLQGVSREDLEYVIRKLRDEGVISAALSAGASRVFIEDHLKLEKLLTKEDAPSMQDEVARFKAQQSQQSDKIKKMQEEQKSRKNNLYAEMEKKLKEELAKKGK